MTKLEGKFYNIFLKKKKIKEKLLDKQTSKSPNYDFDMQPISPFDTPELNPTETPQIMEPIESTVNEEPE